MKVRLERGFRRTFEAVLAEVQTKQLRVGWGEDIKYDTGESVAMVAAQNEFGNPLKHIPPRPFMRPAIADNGAKWNRELAAGIAKSLDGKVTVSDVYEIIGGKVVGDIKKAITAVTAPALSARTIAARAKGGKVTKSLTKPLVDTGYMLNSIIHEEVAK